MRQKQEFHQRYTEAGERLSGVPWAVYPRPQLRRAEWLCLNGLWDFETEAGEKTQIRVPFCPESLLSGVHAPLRYGETLRYGRTFSVPGSWRGRRVLLHFGAVNRACAVRVNGRLVHVNMDPYLAFSADITAALGAGENTLEVQVSHDLSPCFPWGKQRINRGGMWYTPVSGLWQTVWLEPVPEQYIAGLRITPDLRGAEIRAEGVTEGTVLFEGRRIPLRNGAARLEPAFPRLWSPEDPHLFDFAVESGADRVSSYFALRTVTTETVNGIPRLCLNGKPYFFNGLLDQGWFSDGLYTPADPGEYERDILRMKALGFNTLRKHIKVEPEQFYYDCDRLGMVVFQDMVNNGTYHFLRDTALPTLRSLPLRDRHWVRDRQVRGGFLHAMEETVRQLYSHPCVCAWTIFNEGWGQFDADGAYERLRALDGTRIIDSASGWFHQEKSDVDSLHIYFKKLHLGQRRDRPQVLSEFGGYVYKLPEHSFNLEKTYGYRILQDRPEFVKALRALYLEELLPLVRQGLCAAVYTQVSDVEDETNGLLTFDRRVCKLEPEEFADIAPLLQRAVRE